MSYHSSFAKWLINNPNFIKQKIFFNLEKKIYGRYSQKYYPKNINTLISKYLETQKNDFKVISKRKNRIKYFKDPEEFEKFHRLENINNFTNKNKKFKYILNWYKNYLPLINFNNETKYKLIWESYTISYRIINTINFQKNYNINLFNKYIKFETQILLNKLEFFHKGINNHILKNSQAIIFVGLFLEDKNLSKIGFKILYDSLKILINRNGLLRESSSNYQFLICNLLLEISEFILNHKQKPNKILLNYIAKMLNACDFFILNKKMVIFGDTTPDKSVKDLEKNFLNYKNKFPKTSKLIEKKTFKRNIIKNKLGEFYKIKNKNIIVFFKFLNQGLLDFLNHQHEDNFHFNLYYNNMPVLVDLNRLNYIKEDGTFSKHHNSVSVNNFGPLINNSKKYPIKFLKSKNTLKIIKNINIFMGSNCFKFINSDFKWKRNITLSKKEFQLKDVLTSEKSSEKKVYLHFHPNIKFLKRNNNKIIFLNKELNLKIELEILNSKNTKSKLKSSVYSNSYGSKLNTLTLVCENIHDKIFTNKILLRFID